MRIGRRRFGLLGLLGAVVGGRVAPVASAGAAGAALAAMAQALFPHREVSAARYEAIAGDFLAGSGAQAARLAAALAEGGFLERSGAQRVELLATLAASPDFQVFRLHVLTALYTDLGLTRQFGYQGPSLAQGGYLTRGFDDIDWLPAADPDAR